MTDTRKEAEDKVISEATEYLKTRGGTGMRAKAYFELAVERQMRLMETEKRIRLLESTLILIAEPERQNDYTPRELARHALRIEPLKPKGQ